MNASLRRDIVSAYLVTAMRMGAWIVVTATVFRVAGKPAFALLGLVQSTVGILEYAAIGLSPAIIRLTAEALHRANHERQPTDQNAAVQAVYANGFAMALLTALGGAVFLIIFMSCFGSTKTNQQSHGVAAELIVMVGIATLVRMMSDAPGAVLQTRGRIFVDNLLLATHEIVWGAGTWILLLLHLPWQRATGFALVGGSALLLIMRSVLSHRYGSGLFGRWWEKVRTPMVRRLLIFGGMVVAAQMADFLYAPTDNIIITRLLGFQTVGDYGPAVQIDGGMLLVASALATVLLPRTALAHAAGNMQTVRRYYIRGTLFSAALLLAAAPLVWLAAPWLFRIWLSNPMPVTCQILPLMLIHTVVGGSSSVGRSILLAIGKVRPFTVSVLIAGVANVILSYCFVRFGHLGLYGIVLGTIAAVAGRCAVWLPWYTLRVLKRETAEERTPILQTMPPAPII